MPTKLKIQEVELELKASDPSTPTEGQYWYNTTDKCLKLYTTKKLTVYTGKFNQAAADPTVNDDISAGYTVGSRWFNTTSDEEFVCLDDTAAAAIWKSTTGALAPHALGGASHTSDTLANLNSKISDATLIDTGDARLSDARTPTAHGLGGAEHNADTLANLNAKISDATLIDTGDSRLSDSRAPTGSAGGDLGGTYPNPTVNDGADSTAIHDNVSGEISVITEKTTPVSADLLLIEDSAAANAKKRIQIGNLPGGSGSTLGAVQARRSTSYTLTASYADITLDSTDVETDIAALQHSDTNTERIDIVATGTYAISINVAITGQGSTAATHSARVYKNGTTAVPGTTVSALADASTGTDFPVILNRSVIATLAASDYITLQAQASDITNGQVVAANATITAVRLTGVTGPTGPAGADGDITWEGAWSGATAYVTNQAVTYLGTSYVCIANHTNQVPPNATYWDVLASKGDAGSGRIEMLPIYMHNAAYRSSIPVTYETQVYTLFRGSTQMGTPTSAKAIAWVDSGSTGGSVRIYDVTNSQTICEVTTISGTTAAVVDLGTLSNIPTGQAVWEIQTAGDNTYATNIGAVSIRY